MLLVLGRRYSDDSRLLAEAAHREGWDVFRATSNDLPADLAGRACRVYAEGFLVGHFAAQLGLTLLRPSHDALARLDPAFLQRTVRFYRASDVPPLVGEAFVKPADQKLFPAGVYGPGDVVPGLAALLPDDPVLVSAPVTFEREYRFFVRQGRVRTGSVYWSDGEVPDVPVGYEGEGDALWNEARAFAQRVCDAADLPASVVIDVGQLDTGAWAVVEFNPTWASGLYACSPPEVLACLEASQEPG